MEKHTGSPADRNDSGLAGSCAEKAEDSGEDASGTTGGVGWPENAVHGEIRRGRAKRGDLQNV